jgi:aldehyde:ferredoxin oxidoreductase
MPFGFTGKVLKVDLTSKSINIDSPDESFYRRYLGGSLMGLYYLWENSPPGTDPLGSENCMVFAVSPTTGLPISGQSRCTLTCLSPSSGGVADSQAGGFWPAELKFAGFDAIVITGSSDSPVYLWVNNGQAELRDAAHLWGKLTHDVDIMLKEELGDKRIEIAQIGPAGEKLANFAAIMNMSNRAWGRTGVGAVMGSKKLKAIVVRGTQKVTPADKKGLTSLVRKGTKAFPEGEMEEFGRYGTPDTVMGNFGAGGLPAFNWSSGVMPTLQKAESLSGERLYDELLRGAAEGKQDKIGRDTCYACIVRCKRVVESEWRDHKLVPEYGGPEYETIATFGSYCGVDDLHAVTYANQLCNQYGVDTISCGATLSWAIECFEVGIITEEDTGGLKLKFGDAPSMIELLESTLKREGFGDILAEGSAKAADRLGKGHEYLLTVKGQELPAHMPHVKRSLGVIYAVNPFGADHQSSEHDPMYHPKSYEGSESSPGYKRFLSQLGLNSPQHPKVINEEKIEYALVTQYNYSAMETMTLCQFVYGPAWQLFGPNDMAELLAIATDWDVTVEDIQTYGRRRLNLMRALNAREGLTKDDDYLPRKLFKHPLSGGRSDGLVLSEDELVAGLKMYYKQVGWDQATGVPRRDTLEELELGWAADSLGLSD